MKTLSFSIKPYWSDMDALGHINNARYFTYFEEARIKWMESIGLNFSFRENPDSGPVVYSAECRYLKMVQVPTELTITISAGSPGKTSFLFTYEIFEGAEKCAEGSTKIVWVDYTQGRPIRLPEEINCLF